MLLPSRSAPLVTSVLGLAVAVAGCRDKPTPTATATPTSTAPSTPTPTATATPTPSASASAAPTASASPPVPFGPDAGLACKPQRARQTMRWVGPASLSATDTLRVVANKQGIPDVLSLAIDPIAKEPHPSPPLEGQPYGASANPCALAAKSAFCMDRDGAIRRYPLEGAAPPKVVARSRPGTRFAAAALGPDHTVVAYLDERKTTEGMVWEAFVTSDDGADVQRLSEDGSGATFVDLASRGGEVVALMVDARQALTAAHARTLTWGNDKLALGADAVVFVGAPPERRTAGALGVSGGDPSFGLLPLASDDGFGLAVIRIDKKPAVDAPVVWSKYPNGLDPAPIAATRGTTPIRVARVRPAAAAPDSPRVLELGALDANGAFTSHGPLASAKKILDLSVEMDPKGGLWVYYTSDGGSFLERVACP